VIAALVDVFRARIDDEFVARSRHEPQLAS
jgi:hypothetical protein